MGQRSVLRISQPQSSHLNAPASGASSRLWDSFNPSDDMAATSQTKFYATAQDLGSVLSVIEDVGPLQYVPAGMFKSDAPQIYFSYADIPDFGRPSHPTAIVSPAFLLSPQGTRVSAEEVPQQSGGVLFAFDLLRNPDSVALRPGGRYGDSVILYGSLATVSNRKSAKVLYNLIAKALRKNFSKQREFHIGSEARAFCRSGGRLTIGASSPAEFDLICDS